MKTLSSIDFVLTYASPFLMVMTVKNLTTKAELISRICPVSC